MRETKREYEEKGQNRYKNRIDGHALSSSTCCLGFRGTGFEGDFPKKKDPEMKGAL